MSNCTEWKTIIDAAAHNDTEALKNFVQTHELDLKIRNSVGQTAAHIAARNGNLEILKYLLHEEPSLMNIKDGWNQTTFHLAVVTGALDIVKYLVDDREANLFESNTFFPGSSAIHISAAVGKLNVLKYFVEEKKIDVDLKNDAGQSPAFPAAAKNHLHVIKYLVEETNANLTALDYNGENILFLSARTGNLEIPKYLLDEKNITFDLEWKNRIGETILSRAAVFNNYYFVKYLIGEKHVQINTADNDGNTPLHDVAAHANGITLVRYLVKVGANPEAKNKEYKTPKQVATDDRTKDYLQSLTPRQRRRRDARSRQSNSAPKWEDIFDAAEHDDLTAVRYFIEEGGTILADANRKGETVVHIAARKANFAILDYMLDKAPSLIAVKDMQTNTPLHLATRSGHLDVIKYLIDKRNADLLETNYIHLGNTVVHLAAETGITTILKYFLEDKHVNVDIRNDLEQSPIFSAASYKHMNVVKYLYEERKANVTMTDENDDNILYVTARTGDLNLPKYLLDEKNIEFDINRRDKLGETLVHRAARFGRLNFIKYLVEEKEADINLPDKNSRTPLHEAACMGYTELVKYLIEHGADPEAKDKWGRTHMQDNTYRDLINEWQKTMPGAQRERRNAQPETTPIPYYYKLIRMRTVTNDQTLSGGRQVHNDDLRFHRDIDSFLMLAEVCVRFVRRSSYKQAKSVSDVLLSREEILKTRIDPFVVDAIYSRFDDDFNRSKTL